VAISNYFNCRYQGKGKKIPKTVPKSRKKGPFQILLEVRGFIYTSKKPFFFGYRKLFFSFFLSIGRFFVRFLQREITINARAPFS
jgi:hypothetical protein